MNQESKCGTFPARRQADRYISFHLVGKVSAEMQLQPKFQSNRAFYVSTLSLHKFRQVWCFSQFSRPANFNRNLKLCFSVRYFILFKKVSSILGSTLEENFNIAFDVADCWVIENCPLQRFLVYFPSEKPADSNSILKIRLCLHVRYFLFLSLFFYVPWKILEKRTLVFL